MFKLSLVYRNNQLYRLRSFFQLKADLNEEPSRIFIFKRILLSMAKLSFNSDSMSIASLVNIWGTDYPAYSSCSSIPLNNCLPSPASNCTDNNLDTECRTPPSSTYPYALFQYSQNVTFSSITVTLGYDFLNTFLYVQFLYEDNNNFES
jgi:hypothetical protein